MFAKDGDMARTPMEVRVWSENRWYRERGIQGILADVPQAEERVAFETLAKLGVRGTERCERVRRFETERKRGWSRWEGRELQLRVEREARARKLEDITLVLACMIAERVDPASPVHALDLHSVIPELLMALARPSENLSKKAEQISRSLAREREKADQRVKIADRIGRKNRFHSEAARYRGDPNFLQLEEEREWRDTYATVERFLSSRDVEPTSLERLVANASLVTDKDEWKSVTDAMMQALSLGLPERSADALRAERVQLMSAIGKRPSHEEILDTFKRAKLVRRIYASFTALEIQSLASGEGRLPGNLDQGADRDRIAKNIETLHWGANLSEAPWSKRFQERKLSQQADRTRGISIGIEPF